MTVVVRPIERSDRAAWEPLWSGYLDYYEAPPAARHIAETFERLVEGREIHGLVAADGTGTLVGLAHYLFHPDTWQASGKCYLNDLFTSEPARGQGVGEALIAAVGMAAAERGVERVYWMTQDFNATARRLYDRVGILTPFIRYEARRSAG